MNNVPVEEKEEETVVPKLFEDTDNDSIETEVATDNDSDVTEVNDTNTDTNDTDDTVFQKATDFVLNENTESKANVSENYQFADDDNPITAIDNVTGDMTSYKNAYIEHLKNRAESYDGKTKTIMLNKNGVTAKSGITLRKS